MNEIQQLSEIARQACSSVQPVPAEKRAAALLEIACAIVTRKDEILTANAADVMLARRSLQTDIYAENIELDEARIFGISDAINRIAASPVILKRPSGPVYGMFCAANPQNAVLSASLCIMAHSGCVLRVSMDGYATAKALVGVFKDRLRAAGLPAELVALPTDVTAEAVADFLSPDSGLDRLFSLGEGAVPENAAAYAESITDITGLSPTLALAAMSAGELPDRL